MITSSRLIFPSSTKISKTSENTSPASINYCFSPPAAKIAKVQSTTSTLSIRPEERAKMQKYRILCNQHNQNQHSTCKRTMSCEF